VVFFNHIQRLFYKAIQLRVWFASLTVILLFLLLALTVNSAREKDIVEIFSRQHLANVQKGAARMKDVFFQVQKSLSLFSDLSDLRTVSSSAFEDSMQKLTRGWEDTLDTIVYFDAAGRIKKSYPKDALPSADLLEHFYVIRAKQTPYLGLALPKPFPQDKVQPKKERYLIVGYPVKSKNGRLQGVWVVSFSLAAVLDKYFIKEAAEDALKDLWLLDERRQVIVHKDPAAIGTPVKNLLRTRKGAEINLASDRGASFEAISVKEKKRKQRVIVSYFPLKAGDKTWVLLSVAPYSDVISPLRKTFFYTLFSSLLLIIVVIIASMSFAYREGKRLRIREEKKRLTERRDWQEKLLREKKTIEGIMEGLPIPSFVINKEHKVILWNRACKEMTGCSSEEMLGTSNHYRPFYSVQRPLIADLIIDKNLEGLDKYYSGKEIKKSEKVLGAYEAVDYFENLGGQNRVLYFLAAPIYDERGEIIAAIETLQDVTREREMTKSLSEYAEMMQNELIENIELRRQIEELYNYLQAIINSLPDRIYGVDENGIINFVSYGLKHGRTPSREFKNKHFMEFVAPGYEKFVLAKWEDAKKGIYRPYEIEVAGRDGRKRNLLITTSPVIGTNHYIIVQRDITEFKNLEKELYNSQKLAALGQLSAGIAHEIRNPLSSIKMSLQILAKRMNPQGNDLKRFKIAEKEVEHLETLVNDILAFAKPVEPKKTPVSLAKVLEQALALAEKGITDKHIEVLTDYGDVPPVSVDAAMMTDAFLNVIRNAVDALGEKGEIFITLRCHDDARRSVAVEIRDNGIGIDEEDMPHIFNPFFTRKNYGTGLGLSLVKKIVDIHEGMIDISSKKNEGTTVTIVLPLAAEKDVSGTPVS